MQTEPQARALPGARAITLLKSQTPSMAFKLRDGVHWCGCGEQLVFLDLLEDRYSCLSGPAVPTFVRIAAGDRQAQHAEGLHELLDLGLLVESGDEAWFDAPTISPALGDHGEEPYPPAALPDVIAALQAQFRCLILLKLRPLARLVKANSTSVNASKRPSPDTERHIDRLVSAFSAASLLLPSADRCLARALAFRDICRRRGIHPLLVFGVRLNPFAAHCWVQLDGKVLIGDYEQVRTFTAIAAFE